MKNYPELIIGGDTARIEFEEFLDEYFWGYDRKFKDGDPLIGQIFTDWYDNSIEINILNLNPNALKIFIDEKITDEFICRIINGGCSHFWINFYDNEEAEKKKEKFAELYCRLNRDKELEIFF